MKLRHTKSMPVFWATLYVMSNWPTSRTLQFKVQTRFSDFVGHMYTRIWDYKTRQEVPERWSDRI